jgi:hypothetical protein
MTVQVKTSDHDLDSLRYISEERVAGLLEVSKVLGSGLSSEFCLLNASINCL